MAVAPEDMTFDDMEAACAGHFCRALPKAFVSAPLPRGSWNHTNFPMMEVQEIDLTPMTHFIEVITGHRMETPFEDVELNYKKAIDTQDLQLLPPPFGPKTMVPNTVKLQMVIVEENDATVTIFKHYFFANKAKASYCPVDILAQEPGWVDCIGEHVAGASQDVKLSIDTEKRSILAWSENHVRYCILHFSNLL